ncbi:MAG: RagB/SusD family nutrient uptake outer membrane protein, partial [Saprospiraceae bacterium]|nr:RagB/SusD family nutrient uptake outer membrane protein [Saprospiraceae bacterium]
GGVNDIHGIPEEIWTEVYEAINRANVVINANIDVPAPVQDDADQFLGEAYALRALAHFDLVRVYAQHYGFTSDNSHPGVPIITEFDPAAEPARRTVAEVYSAVIADLNTALGLMNQDRGTGFFSPDAARALLARIYLYQSDWNNAKTAADAVIASAGGLTSTDDYVDRWMDRGTAPDVLFEVINTDTDNNGSDALGRMYINEGYGDYLPSDDVYNLIDPEDVRIQLFKIDSTIGGGDFGYRRLNKFPDREGRDNTPVIRLSEIYLIRAEANAMLGNEAAAIGDLMAVRSRAWPTAPMVNASGQALLDEIEKEKRVELMFEGHRLWELMRKKKGVIRNNCTVPPDLNGCEINYPDH